MRKLRILASAIFIVMLAATSAAQEKDLLSLAGDLGGVLEWDPLRDVGIISFGSDRIALGVGIDLAVINYRLKVGIDAPLRKKGAVWLTSASVAALSEAVQKDRLAHAGDHLRVAAILIDPGHGGKDGGAVGSVVVGKRQITIREKDVTLTVARRLSDMLKSAFPDKEILFTRTVDSFVSLEDRVVVANSLLEKSKETVLYISIHANTSPFNKNASGFEVWCLPPEYKRTLVDETTAGKENHEILPILNGMLEEEISLESTVLAQEILSGLNAKIGQLSADRGLRQNDWYVVRNARMPAVLVEVGFVSNPDEAARLADDAYLKDVAAGMYSGVQAFIGRFEQNGSAGAR
jgi:N-acetylmuramoyl-L-alanine amidase